MAGEARVGLYYAPLPDDPLFAASCAWLGRDPFLGCPVAQPALPGIEEVTADARGYGFHATLTRFDPAFPSSSYPSKQISRDQ